MRKAIYLGAALAAVMTTSCSSDMDQFDATRGDGNVAIQLQLPDNFATRSFGDGMTAKKLQYAVYHSDAVANADGEKKVVTEGEATFSGLNATVNLNLVNGVTYDFVFWADVPTGSPYTFNSKTQTISVSYDNLNGNDETRDAFFGQLKEQKITGPTTLSATLKRPFAQINLGTSDFNTDAVKAAYPDFKSSMTITTKLPTTLNLLDGSVSAMTTANVATTSEARPTVWSEENTTGEKFPVDGYQYISMNYILVDAKKAVLDLAFSFQNAGSEISNLTLSSVPVQRNYRTNIYGAVLTSPTDVKITIDPIFATPDYEIVKEVNSAEDFKNALKDMTKEINLSESLDLSDLSADDLKISSPKVINIGSVNTATRADEEIILTLDPQKPFDVRASLTINGGTITNGQGDLGAGQAVNMFHVRKDGELNLNGVKIDGNTDHHYHGSGINSAVIDYWDNAVINITDSYIKTGEFVVCGMGAAVGSKMTFTKSYMESTSSSGYGTKNWSYAFRLHGGEAIFKDCTVVGIQGGVSGGRGATITFESGTYYTHNNPGKTDAFYAVYMTGGSTAVINGGYFYGANIREAQLGTAAVVGGDNDTGQPLGFVEIKGGYFSGLPYYKGGTYEPAEGFQFKPIDKTVDGRKYVLTVVKTTEPAE